MHGLQNRDSSLLYQVLLSVKPIHELLIHRELDIFSNLADLQAFADL